MAVDRPNFGLAIDLKHLSWTPKKEAIQKEIIFDLVHEEQTHGHEALTQEPKRSSWADFELIALELGLKSDELHQKIDDDPQQFKSIFAIAKDKNVQWTDAEEIYNQKQVRNQMLLDKISDYHHSKSRFKKEPKPSRMYKEFHKPRSKKGKRERLAKLANHYAAVSAINTERATPLDEYPDVF